jgi:hypothetical protein
MKVDTALAEAGIPQKRILGAVNPDCYQPYIFVPLKPGLFEKVTKALIQDWIDKNEIELSSTHAKLCVPIINRIYKKMVAGINFTAIKVDNTLICDGHHRYIASLLAGFTLSKIPASSTSATQAVDWKLVSFEEDDWDTPAKIKMLNEKDAVYNNISMVEIAKLLE